MASDFGPWYLCEGRIFKSSVYLIVKYLNWSVQLKWPSKIYLFSVSFPGKLLVFIYACFLCFYYFPIIIVLT
jgi:hypothetical protein